MQIPERLIPYLQVLPLTLVLLLFLGVPLAIVVVVSFFDFDIVSLIPTFTLQNYVELFSSRLTFDLYLSTLKYALLVWAITLVIGFTVAYFLVFHVKTLLWQIALFLLCTVPFWTSNIIRMISWIPFLGLNGIFNQSLMALGIVDHPLAFLLFSDFAVVTAYVHLFTLFMIVPIFNAMARIDPAIVEAARDGGASGFKILTTIVIPLVQDRHRARLDLRDRAGHGRFLRGQGHERRPERQRRVRDVERDRDAPVPAGGGQRRGPDRHRLADGGGDPQDRRRPARAGRLRARRHGTARSGRRPWTFYALAAFFTLFVLFLYGPMSAIYILSFQGPSGGLTFPLNGVSLNWFYALFQQQRTGDIAGSFARSIVLALLVLALTVVISVMAGLAFRRRFFGAGVIFYMAIASLIMPGLLVSLGIGLMFQFLGIKTNWYTSALGAHLTWTLPFGLLDHVRRVQPVQPRLRGGGARPRRQPLGDPLDDRAADPAARHDRGGALRLHAFLRRVPAHLDRRRPQQHTCRSRSGT